MIIESFGKLGLGLDVSSSCVGWSILNLETNTFVDHGYIKLKTNKSFLERVPAVEEGFLEIYKKYPDIQQIAIEEPLQSFRPGFSSAATLILLARFNGIVSWLSYQIWGVEPYFVSSKNARTACKIKLIKGEDTKEQLMKWVEAKTNVKLPRKTVSAGKNKGNIEWADGANDEADACITILGSNLLNFIKVVKIKRAKLPKQNKNIK